MHILNDEVVVVTNKRVMWSEEQIGYLKENYSTMTVSDISKFLNIDEKRIRKKAVSLGLTKSKDHYKFQQWDDNDVKILTDNYYELAVPEIAKLLNNKFNDKQIRNKISKLGLKKSNSWNDIQINYLKENYMNMTVNEMRKDALSKFSVSAIQNKMHLLGLTVDKLNRWNDDEIEILKRNYSKYPNKEISEMLPRFNISQIKSKARQLGLKKDKLTLIKSHQDKRSNKWSDEEKSILIKYYSGIPTKELQEKYLPHRSIKGIKTIASRLGLVKDYGGKFYWELSAYDVVVNEEASIKLTFRKESGK